MGTRDIPQHYNDCLLKLITNIKINGEKFKAISLAAGARQHRPLSSYLFNIVLKFFTRKNKITEDQGSIY